MNPRQNRADNSETRWTLIQNVQGTDEATRRKALEELCRVYRRVVIAALIGKHGFQADEVEDIAQAFLSYVLLQRTFDRADATKGRFRNFLFTFLDQFVAHHRRRQRAQKRGGGQSQISLDDLRTPSGALPIEDGQVTPAEELDRAWARATWKEALRRLREDYRTRSNEAEFDCLLELVERDTHAAGYSAHAEKMGVTEEALRQRSSRFRKQVRAAVQSVVRDTVGTEADVEGELAYIWRCLR